MQDGEGSGDDNARPSVDRPGRDAAPFADAPGVPDDVYGWRKRERERLIDRRLQHPADARAQAAAKITERLRKAVGDVRGKRISLYWPFRGEPDLRPWIEEIWLGGGMALLPIVVEKRHPLVFRSWRHGERLERGIWNIPVPADGTVANPDIVIAPVVGFDPAHYRLGYGGGFFDRTLAALPEKPLAIGVGYGSQAMATIHPQPHDIPMDRIIAAEICDAG
ncbi:MAG TPA: 5-formyltetrahydrofolate cyclo-ligase [Mycoplana sp.]|nr:5-formyltetrahydrofolate cyclo-ligase [Mycoplana sp.]